VLTRHGGQILDVEFVIYLDGPTRVVGQRFNQEFIGDFRLSPPPGLIQSSAGQAL
jgi:hypothetical protein